MTKVLHTQSTLTDRYQTTIPEPIREALHLGKRDKIDYTIDANGKVMLTRAEEDDPTLGKFLVFLDKDLQKHPEHINSISTTLSARAKKLVSGIEVDLDTPLAEKDE